MMTFRAPAFRERPNRSLRQPYGGPPKRRPSASALRTLSCHLARWDDDHRAVGVVHDSLGNTSQQQRPDAREAATAEHDRAHLKFVSLFQDGLPNRQAALPGGADLLAAVRERGAPLRAVFAVFSGLTEAATFARSLASWRLVFAASRRSVFRALARSL